MTEIAVTIIKILNALAALVLIVAGLWIFVTVTFSGDFSPWSVFTPIYLILYGVLLVAAELKQEKLLDYFGFLKTFLGRGLFYIFLSGVVCFAYYQGNSHTAADIYATILFVLGVLYLLMNFYVKNNNFIFLKAQRSNREPKEGTIFIFLILLSLWMRD